MAQSQISRTLWEEASVSRVAAIPSRESFESRSALGRRVCEEFSFLDARGRPQLAGCMKAFADLAGRVPDIVLPPPKAPAADSRPRIVEGSVPEPEGVPSHPARTEGLRIDPVAKPGDRALWNTLVAREHPHGMTTFAGRQVPDCEPQLMFAYGELGFLRGYAARYGLKAPERLGDAVRLVAHLGGYRDRKHDPDPGNQIMWHGQTRLTSAALGHAIGFRAGRRHALREPK